MKRLLILFISFLILSCNSETHWYKFEVTTKGGIKDTIVAHSYTHYFEEKCVHFKEGGSFTDVVKIKMLGEVEGPDKIE
jgi:hypothetical protein